jgi:hypothetical protein
LRVAAELVTPKVLALLNHRYELGLNKIALPVFSPLEHLTD